MLLQSDFIQKAKVGGEDVLRVCPENTFINKLTIPLVMTASLSAL
jgi:hypothetical protein